MLLSPGDWHPNVPCAAEELARRLAVAPEAVAAWCDDGMPVLPDGRLDPYAVTNWLSWGRLDRCPALARRWRSWLRWFSTVGRPCRLDVRRAQTCYLPEPRGLLWRVREPVDAPGQHVLGRIWSEGEPLGDCRLITRAPALRHEWQCQDEIALEPFEVVVGDRPVFEQLVATVAGSFVYAYRQHLPDDTGDPARDGGTCLDLALRCGAELARGGRRWRLVSGVVAHRALANVHFWIEAEDTGGAWIPIDPTIPAVARMLGADWRALIPLVVGRHDARRIRIAHHEGPMKTLGGIAGLVDADGDEALYCTDWAVGECAWSVAAA
jgi:hypothetical protein